MWVALILDDRRHRTDWYSNLQDMFTPKDRTAYRYFHKRAHYIAVIASSLQALGKPATKAKQDDMSKIWKSMTVEWDFEGGDMRRPILALTFPKGKLDIPRSAAAY